jgi:hypothetical protein
MKNIDLMYPNDPLTYVNIRDYSYDSSSKMVWFTDKDGYKHEARVRWHYWESK